MAIFADPRKPLSRREALAMLGACGALTLAGCVDGGDDSSASTATNGPAVSDTSAASCVLTPTLTEGPFFVDERLNRSDITTGTTAPAVLNGLPLRLMINVYNASTAACTPLPGVQIDVWHTHAEGLYSDISTRQGQNVSTVGQMYLRGYQVTDANGRVTFQTIYPGWYQGRTVHIHVKARLFDAAGNRTFEFTTQTFFDDATTDAVFATAPYNSRGTRSTRNATDNIFNNNTGLILALQRPSDGSAGYVGTFTLGLAR